MSGTVVGIGAGSAASAGASIQGLDMMGEASEVAAAGGDITDSREYAYTSVLPTTFGASTLKSSTAASNLSKPVTALTGSVTAPIASMAGLGASAVGLAGVAGSTAVQASKAGLVASGVPGVTSMFTGNAAEKQRREEAIARRRRPRDEAALRSLQHVVPGSYSVPIRSLQRVVPGSYSVPMSTTPHRSSRRRSSPRRSVRRRSVRNRSSRRSVRR